MSAVEIPPGVRQVRVNARAATAFNHAIGTARSQILVKETGYSQAPRVDTAHKEHGTTPVHISRMVYALLTDTTGYVLLLRRRGSALWNLPGGEVRPAMNSDDLLNIYCQRQIGVAPESFGPIQAFVLAGVPHAVAVGTILRARASARGRVDAVHWVRLDALPTETHPAARVAVATLARELLASRTSAIASTPTHSLQAI